MFPSGIKLRKIDFIQKVFASFLGLMHFGVVVSSGIRSCAARKRHKKACSKALLPLPDGCHRTSSAPDAPNTAGTITLTLGIMRLDQGNRALSQHARPDPPLSGSARCGLAYVRRHTLNGYVFHRDSPFNSCMTRPKSGSLFQSSLAIIEHACSASKLILIRVLCE